MKKRVGQIEFRWSETNNSYELTQWLQSQTEDKEYCIVIAFMRKGSEGYYMETVGDRHLNALREWQKETTLITEYAFDFLEAEYNLYRSALENNLTITS